MQVQKIQHQFFVLIASNFPEVSLVSPLYWMPNGVGVVQLMGNASTVIERNPVVVGAMGKQNRLSDVGCRCF